MRRRFWILWLTLALTLAGCDGHTPEPTAPEEPTLAPCPYSAEDFSADPPWITYDGPHTAHRGIDVSTFQDYIDWDAVAAEGVEFVILRAGYRGYTEGALHSDDLFSAYIEGAQAAGLDVGVYFFSQAVSVEEAREEAEYVCALLSPYSISYPVMFDWERMENTRSADVPYATVTDCAKTFCQIVEHAGYRAGFYFNLEMSRNMDLTELKDYAFWLAEYTDAPSYAYDFDFWQYSCTGEVEGIGVGVDLNLYIEK